MKEVKNKRKEKVAIKSQTHYFKILDGVLGYTERSWSTLPSGTRAALASGLIQKESQDRTTISRVGAYTPIM